MPVSEIITVEETDVNGKQYSSGKWQKMERPYAFTGTAAERRFSHSGRSRERGIFCHLFNTLLVSLVCVALFCFLAAAGSGLMGDLSSQPRD